MSSHSNSGTYFPEFTLIPTLDDSAAHQSTQSQRPSHHFHTPSDRPTSSMDPSRHPHDGTSHTGSGNFGPSLNSNVLPSSSNSMFEEGTAHIGSGNTRSSRQGSTSGDRGTWSQFGSSGGRQQLSVTEETPTDVSQDGPSTSAPRDDDPADLDWVDEVKTRAIKTLLRCAILRYDETIVTVGRRVLNIRESEYRTRIDRGGTLPPEEHCLTRREVERGFEVTVDGFLAAADTRPRRAGPSEDWRRLYGI